MIPGSDPTTLAALGYARQLAKAGVPLFVAGLTAEGDPIAPKKWHLTEPDPAIVDSWKPGRALCAVTGVRFDVIDIDPRNGGDDSFTRLDDLLGDDGPEVLLKYATPSGGQHLWIGPLGLGSHNGIMPGIDLKGGKEDGTGRGFVFIPPTARLSRVGPGGRGRPKVLPYRYHRAPRLRVKDPGTAAIGRLFADTLASRAMANGNGGGRLSLEDLEDACFDAETGDQRAALRALVGEMQKQGIRRKRIREEVMGIVLQMPNHNPDDPWRDDERTRKYINTLFYAPGRIIPDASGEEAVILSELGQPSVAGLVRAMSSLPDEVVRWLWPGYVAFRELTLMDGEKGLGKSFVTDWLSRCATLGLAFPGQPEAVCDPIRVIIFTDEGHANSVTKPRLRACDANLDMVYLPAIKVPRRGERFEDWNLGLPQGAATMGKMIAQSGAQLAIFDPITDFLGEDINTHNDAQVRRALRPLAIMLGQTGCAGFAIRHMNKDTRADARYRGSGSTAFQNRARVHLVTSRVPTSYVLSGEEGQFGIAMVDSNLAVRVEGALVYSIDDSDIQMDDLGNMVGIAKWHGYKDIDILSANSNRRGPDPGPEREQAMLLLTEMFTEKQTWKEAEAQAELAGAGIVLNPRTLRKVTEDLGIRRERLYETGKRGIQGWLWTVVKEKARDDSESG